MNAPDDVAVMGDDEWLPFEAAIAPAPTIAELRAEVERLRAEVSRLRELVGRVEYAECGCLGGMLSDIDAA